MSMDLDIRQLRAVVAVADRGGFTAAAQTIRVAQSSLSRTVLDIERRLGTTLFDRNTRHVTPTREGTEFLRLARHVLAEFDSAMSHFDGYLAGTQGTVSVSALPSLAATLLPPVLAAYRRSRPEVAVTVYDGLSQDVMNRVREGQVDLAVTIAPDTGSRLEEVAVAADRFFCITGPGHPLLDRRRVTWRNLAALPFVAFDPTSSIRAYTDRALAQADVVTGPVTEARNIASVAGLVAADLGVSVVPGLVLPLMRFAGLHRRALAEPVVEREICLVRDPARPLSPAASALAAMLVTADVHGIELPAGARWLPPST